MELRDRILRTSDKLHEAWNAHDPDAIAEVYVDDALVLDAVSGITTKGRDAIRADALAHLAAFPDVSIERHTRLIDGSHSADQWVIRATHTGEYDGIPATGNSIEVAVATFSQHDEEGLVACSTHYIDVPAFMQQLGVF